MLKCPVAMYDKAEHVLSAETVNVRTPGPFPKAERAS